ncbi:hypothetical protein M6D93_04960 [Jatrophihabitans telluris]|uniref:DUF4352 domain-containing protein n=1 Tax=Jatrophihabitans telluris TaxID=2038343 RepID=A0ABY4R2I3_9ACTN|nr:hypothetical protein [Jatrophihabitans telluris]UQX89355.1 hypothetical protein M6D93_04960 [Jatrophihabitans telluris]
MGSTSTHVHGRKQHGQTLTAGATRLRLVSGTVLGALVLTGALSACSGSHKNAAGSTGATTAGAQSSSSTGATTAGASRTGTASASSSASATVSTAPGTKVTSGSVNQTVPAKSLETKSAVSLSSPANFGNGVTAKVSEVKTITAKAQGPGEVSGPATEFVLSMTNGTNKTLDLSSVTVTVLDKAGTPFQQMIGSPSKPLSGHAAAGASARGTYVFAQPASFKNPITISFNYSVEAPVVLFTGNAQ